MVDDREREPRVLLGRARRCGKGTPAASPARNSSDTVASIGVSTMPGAIVMTRMPYWARSRAAGSVRPTIAPLDDAYAAWPTCPSNAAMLAVLMTTPRWPVSSGSVAAMASAATARTVNEPMRLISTTLR